MFLIWTQESWPYWTLENAAIGSFKSNLNPRECNHFSSDTLSLPHTNQFHATYFSSHISCIALESTIRFSRLLKNHSLINSLATATSPSAHSSHNLCLWQGCGVWLHITQVKASKRLSNGATTRILIVLEVPCDKILSWKHEMILLFKDQEESLNSDGLMHREVMIFIFLSLLL